MRKFPYTTRDVAEDIDPSWWGDETRVRAVRRALDALWHRGLVDKAVVTWSGDGEIKAGTSSWRIHDDNRPPEPRESTRDPYGRVI